MCNQSINQSQEVKYCSFHLWATAREAAIMETEKVEWWLLGTAGWQRWGTVT